MKIEELEIFLALAGRYQIYSNGRGDYVAYPLLESEILMAGEAVEQLNANAEKLIYNNQQD